MDYDNTPAHGDHNIDFDALAHRVDELEKYGITDPITFSSRPLILAVFPHSHRIDAKGKDLELINGDLKITMYSRKGLPYGHYPRLIMLWLTRECLRRKAAGLTGNQARTIPLGNSLTGFLRSVGIIKKGQRLSGGVGGRTASFQEQLNRLFSTQISIDKFTTYSANLVCEQSYELPITRKKELWWDPKNPDDPTLFESYVELSEDFYNELVAHSFPLDPLHLCHFATSPLALDLYSWITYRIATHNGFTRVTWEQIRAQIGTSYPKTAQGMRDFRKQVRIALEKICEAWPEAGVREWDNGLELTGKNPAVAKRESFEILPDDDFNPF